MLVASALVAGCGSAPVAPLPGRWPSHTPAGTATGIAASGTSPGPSVTSARALPPPAPVPVTTPRRTRTAGTTSPSTELSPACLPPVIYSVDGSDPALLPKALCLTVASVLRVQNVGPGTVTATPADRVAQHWEGGVVDCRLLSAGSVTVEITGEAGSHTITVLVVE